MSVESFDDRQDVRPNQLLETTTEEGPHAESDANRKIGTYTDVRKIGKGGMGTVYEAYDPHLQRRVAIKELPRENREGAAMARMNNHPNIVSVHHAFQEGDSFFLVMELVSDGSLQDRLQQGPLQEHEALEVASQMATGLAFALRKGVVHCDVKPGNVLLASDGAVKITDFGLSKFYGDDADSTSSSGTYLYMDPLIHVNKDRTATTEADVYSVGATLYHSLSGVAPFSDNADLSSANRSEFEQAIRNGVRPTSIRELAPHVSPEVLDFVERLMAAGPENRPGMEEVKRQLNALLSRSPSLMRNRSFQAAVAATILLSIAGLFRLALQDSEGGDGASLPQASKSVANKAIDADLSLDPNTFIQNVSGRLEELGFSDGQLSSHELFDLRGTDINLQSATTVVLPTKGDYYAFAVPGETRDMNVRGEQKSVTIQIPVFVKDDKVLVVNRKFNDMDNGILGIDLENREGLYRGRDGQGSDLRFIAGKITGRKVDERDDKVEAGPFVAEVLDGFELDRDADLSGIDPSVFFQIDILLTDLKREYFKESFAKNRSRTQ